MVEDIFASMPGLFVAGSGIKPATYYFTLGEIKRTVKLSPTVCLVEDGKTVDNADCVCKTSPEFFAKIWQEGYRPGMKDFLAGTIKSNNPSALQTFLQCFGKDA